MKLKVWLALSLVIVCCALPALAQEQKQPPQMSAQEKAMMDAWMKFATPGEGHKALDPMVGSWEAKVTMWQAPGAPPQVSTATSESRWILGNRYVEEHVNGTFMGMPFEGIGYTGYDNAKKQYFGTWLDNFGTGVMTSTGSTSDKGKTWNFKSTTTDPMTGKDMPGETKVTVTDADHHTMEMWGPAPDGKTFKMMQLDYSRKK
ncbi:MAG TPA: DUF1579 domain-containing protein [Thermoanaerobaculia bacterium]|nr:DUF1579 domain-containing protein [Thermoanaerobaculia bacterium]